MGFVMHAYQYVGYLDIFGIKKVSNLPEHLADVQRLSKVLCIPLAMTINTMSL